MKREFTVYFSYGASPSLNTPFHKMYKFLPSLKKRQKRIIRELGLGESYRRYGVKGFEVIRTQ